MVISTVLIIYILIGAVVMFAWEDWTLTEGSYYAFTTISTIGFGDYVPGRDGFESVRQKKYFILN